MTILVNAMAVLAMAIRVGQGHEGSAMAGTSDSGIARGQHDGRHE